MIVNILGIFFYLATWSNLVLSRYFSKYLLAFLLRLSIRLLFSCEPGTLLGPTEEADYHGLGHFHFHICDFILLFIFVPICRFLGAFLTFSSGNWVLTEQRGLIVFKHHNLFYELTWCK